MGNMKYILIILLFACNTAHLSEQKQELGQVFEKQYTPEINASGSGVGFSSSGSTVITHTSVHDAEKYLLFFKCEHGVMFQVEDKHLWSNLNKGDSVRIYYYDILDEENKLIDFKFKTAVKQ